MQGGLRVSTAPVKGRKPAPVFVEDLKRFKGFARKLAAASPAGNKSGVLIEWASSCSDLHRILDVTRSLFLISQSHNEILLRVGLELATSKIAYKIFQWTDGEWYSDESRREWFRDVVQTNLTKVLDACAGERPDDDEQLAAANLTVKEVQAELVQAVEKCQAAEILVERTQSQVQNLERALEDKSERFFHSQKQLDEAEVKLKTAYHRLAETRKAAAAVEAQLRDANAKCLGLESDLRHRRAASGSQLEGSIAEDKEKVSVAQVSVAALRVSETRAQSAEIAHSRVLAELQQNATALETWVGTAESAKSQVVELMSSVSQLEEQVVFGGRIQLAPHIVAGMRS
jgi:hypothetical protein